MGDRCKHAIRMASVFLTSISEAERKWSHIFNILWKIIFSAEFWTKLSIKWEDRVKFITYASFIIFLNYILYISSQEDELDGNESITRKQGIWSSDSRSKVEPLAMPASHIRVQSRILTPLLMIQVPANSPGKAVEDGKSARSPCHPCGESEWSFWLLA